MDAALDAMRQYGFGIKMTRETVQELLDVGFLFSQRFKRKKC